MPEQDIDTLRQRWEADRSRSATLELAGEYRRRGQPELAVEVLDADLELHPDHVAARVAKGRCHLELEQVEEARRELEQAAVADPAHLAANQLLTEAHARLGDLGRARDRLDLFALLGGDDAEIQQLEEMLARPRSEPEPAPVQAPRLESSEAPRLESSQAPRLESSEPPRLESSEPPRPEPAEAASPEPAEAASPEPAEARSPEPAAPPAPAGRAASAPKAPDSDPWVLLDWIEFDEARYASALFAEGLFSPPGGARAAVGRAAGAVAASATAPTTAEPAPTLTLAELYRKQGHREEAAGILRQILERQPGNAEAARVLGELEKQGSWPLSAEDLLGGGAAPRAGAGEGSTADLLRRYRERLRGGK